MQGVFSIIKRKVFVVLILSFFITFFLIIGCSSLVDETSSQNLDETKKAEYSNVLKDLHNDSLQNSTINAGLDRRYVYLENQIDEILVGNNVLDMATFVRFKIELDYLEIQEYDSIKINVLSNKFMQAFAKIQQEATNVTTTGMSLNDRYYSLERKLERISSGSLNLTVLEYISLEDGLTKLEKEEYIQSRVDELKSTLSNLVILELENAIIEYSVPEIPEEVEEEIIEESEEVILENETDTVESIEEIIEGPIKIVTLIDGGFDVEILEIRVNDTVVWENKRTGQYKMGFIVGNRNCNNVKSKFFYPPDSFNATFTQVGTCWISDGIFTTQAIKIVIT
jgi:hypothetical protein